MANISYEYKGTNNYVYSVDIRKNESNIEISIGDKNSIMGGKFKISLSLEEIQKLNRYYKQFENIEEIYQNFTEIEDISKLTKIELDKDLLKFSLTIPNIPKTNPNKCIELMIKGEKMSENDILFKLCDKVKEIDVLKRKNEYLFHLLGKTEKDFENYEKAKELFPNLSEIIEYSNVIRYNDLIPVQEGILKKLNKKIKDIKLIYRASRDGDGCSKFHSKCNGIQNTVTFVKAKNGRKFGGFSEQAWNSNGDWYTDNNTFLFSLDSKECYFYKQGNCMYGHSSYGPYWGSGADLYTSDRFNSHNGGSTQSSSFEYNGKTNCLSGKTSFKTEDYEVYQLTLE